jgi:hypothetical protein
MSTALTATIMSLATRGYACREGDDEKYNQRTNPEGKRKKRVGKYQLDLGNKNDNVK